MRKIAMKFVVALLLGAMAIPSGLAAKCFIFVHGHRDSNQTYNTARDYWKTEGGWFTDDSDMVNMVAKNNKHYVVHWNPTVYYWDGAVEVAGKINNALNGGSDGGGNNCAGESSFVVVAHSMGGAVMDFIFGSSSSSDPYYNYKGDKVGTMVAVQGAHRGAYAADLVCSSGFTSFIIGMFTSCDNGTASLQTADSWQVRTYANSPRTNTYLISGYEAIFGSSALLSGEDDGLLAYASTFACSGSATGYYDTGKVCSGKQESYGFLDCDQAHENHSDGRNDEDRDNRLAISGGHCWSGYSTGAKVRSSMSSAELIRCLWAYKPWGDTACN